jgi:hypothetical protein
MTVALDAAIETFRDHPDARRCQTPDGARHGCARANILFATHCWARGVDARIVWFANSAGRLDAAWAGAFVDWSIRQFDPTATVPHVFSTAQWLRYRGYEPARLGVWLEEDATLLRTAGLDPLMQPPYQDTDQQQRIRWLAIRAHERKLLLARARRTRTAG